MPRSVPEIGSFFEICESRLVLSAQVLADMADSLMDALEPQAAGVPLTLFNSPHSLSGVQAVHEIYGLTGTGQTVAVVDSGVTWDHVALGQGFGPGYRVVGGWDFAENDGLPYDDGPNGFHGTHVSGIIASDHPQAPGIAPGVDLVALRVFDDVGQGKLEWVEEALRWVLDHRESFEHPITTVNVSVGTLWNAEEVPEWSTLEDELQELHAAGVLVTASAGNSFDGSMESGLSYPASSPYVLPVGSVDADGSVSDFSQRSPRTLLAPGADIVSAVPDHVLGRDGKLDDFTAGSGTSMASPYVAGASTLVRQAFWMTSGNDVDADYLTSHLRDTSDLVYDAETDQSYQRINVEQAISAIIPADNVGDTAGQATPVEYPSELVTWINRLDDVDAYRLEVDAAGLLSIRTHSDWMADAHWTLEVDGKYFAEGGLGNTEIELPGSGVYNLFVSSAGAIGPIDMELDFDIGPLEPDEVLSAQPAPQQSISQPEPIIELGAIDFAQLNAHSGNQFVATATRDGFFSVVWEPDSHSESSLLVQHGVNQHRLVEMPGGESSRIDLRAVAGERFEFHLPQGFEGRAGISGQLTLVNTVLQQGSSLTVYGTSQQDFLAVDLSSGFVLGMGGVEYAFDSGEISSVEIQDLGNFDRLQAHGSTEVERVYLRPGESSLENSHVQVSVRGVEEITYISGGGNDRVYLYDSDADDTLRAYPGTAELVGVGYRFETHDVPRIFVHATGSGEDHAYLYDSAGDDRLSARPQFTSFSGAEFFNYVRGFERVYAYANAGGFDTAELYDSAGSDRFNSSGSSASLVGPGFSSHTRSFESVISHATAGGTDSASLYAADSSDRQDLDTRWQQTNDFVSLRMGDWQREVRGFHEIQAFGDGEPIQLQPHSAGFALRAEEELLSTKPNENTPSNDLSSAAVALPFQLVLPEEACMQDAALEREHLHEAFRWFDEQYQE
ncbi:MAG: S8 family serine peptidase [bacterium]|nr:S8 family serine peptidase [bacterium]